MAKQTVKITGEATPVQIAQWKQKYGDVFAIEVAVSESGGEVAVGYFRAPDLQVLSLASRFSNDNVKAGEALLENLWLGGDERFKTDDMVKLSAFQHFPKLVEVKQSSIKKL